MARPKKVETLDADQESAELLEQIYNAESLNPALETIKAELNITGDADETVYVSKLNGDDAGNEMTCWKGDPDAYDLEQIAKRFGSGQYRVMVYMKIPSGHKVRKFNKVIGWILSAEDEARRKSATVAPVVANQESSGLVSVLQEMMKDQRAANERMLAAISQRPDPMQGLTQLAGLLKSIMPAQAAPAAPGMMEVLTAAKTIIDIGKSTAPSVPEGAGLEGVALSKGLDLVGKMFERATTQPAAAAPAALPNPDAAQAELSEDEQEQLDMLKLYLRLANVAAKRGTKPDDFANEHYESIPDETLAQLATDPNWFAALVNLIPDCGNFRGWYEQVRNRLVANAVEDGVLTQEGQLRSVDESATPEGSPANGAAGSVNAAPGAGGNAE